MELVTKYHGVREYSIENITGTDDEINQLQQVDTKPIEIPFDTTISGNIDIAQGFLESLQLSIRPIQLIKIDFSGLDSQLKIHVSAKSFYQPQKTIKITKKVVK